MLKKLFTWWNDATLGTAFTLFRRGAREVGVDEQGNRYFEERDPSAPDGRGRKRRWVLYNGVVDGSRVPPDWHGWLHYSFDEPPTTAPLTRRPWEKDHLPNMSGTPLAYHPAGSLWRPDGPARLDQDYEPWSPENGSRKNGPSAGG